MRQRIFLRVILAINFLFIGFQMYACGAAPLKLPTGPSRGVCYWECVDRVLDTRGEPANVTERVVASRSIEASLATVGQFVAVEPVPTFQEAVPLVHRGVNVIATLKLPAGRHAVVIVDVNERIVTYWNPGEPTAYRTMGVKEFRGLWAIGTVIK